MTKPIPMDQVRCGFDGNPPIFPGLRDLDGQGKRSNIGITNVNTDRLEYLFAHRRITEPQRDAGRKLQNDAQLAQIGRASCRERVSYHV